MFSDPVGVVVNTKGGAPRTSHVMNKLKHVFAGPIEGFVRAERAQLALCHIMVTVMDWDIASADDGFGSIAVSLDEVAKKCVDGQTGSWSLAQPLTLDGQLAGTISFDISMVEHNVALKTAGCCTLL